MEHIQLMLTRIKEGLGSLAKQSEHSSKMLILCEELINVCRGIVSQEDTLRSWTDKDRVGIKRFINGCEQFIELNAELILPSHL